MKLEDLLQNRCQWLSGSGPKSNIAISTRVRVARNLSGHIYFNWADEDQREKTLAEIVKAVKKSSYLKGAYFIRIKDVSSLERQFLIERHLMSPDHAREAASKALIVGDREIVSVMLNEEDHIRLQVLQSGFNVMEAWRMADEVDTELGKITPFDYSNKFGFLTACPTNTGTGLRVSVMLHLSALAMTGQIENVYDAISKVGMTIRGFYGEGTKALGDFFQISNQLALGHSEMDILDNLERVISKIIIREEFTREELLKRKKEEIADRVFRSFGTLNSARIITFNETIKLLSTVRLGLDLGLLKEDIDINKINEILLVSQPAHLQKVTHHEIAPYDRDIKRADLIREKLIGGEKDAGI